MSIFLQSSLMTTWDDEQLLNICFYFSLLKAHLRKRTFWKNINFSFKMALRSQHNTALIFFVCLSVLIMINSKLFVSHQNGYEINDLRSYKLNLTGNFIPITDKEKNLFSKLKSIQVCLWPHLSIPFCDKKKPLKFIGY